MPRPRTPRKPLRGRDAICTYLDISLRTFYRLRAEGLPIRSLCGLTAIPDELDRWVTERPLKR